MKQFLPNLTLKKLSDTRWESRISAIRPVRYQLGEIYDALLFIKNNKNLNGSHGLHTKAEATSLAKHISNYKFICNTII